MKLRINAKLRAALIAAVTAVGFTLPQTYATVNWTGGNPSGDWFYTNNGKTDATLLDDEHGQVNITAEGSNPVTATIVSITVKDGATVHITGGNFWGPDRTFGALTVNDITTAGGTGSILLNTQPYTAGKAPENTTVTVKAVTATLSGVQNYGVLTLGVDGTSSFNLTGGIVNNTGSVTLNGTYSFDTTDASKYTVKQEGSATWTDVTNRQGFKKTTGSTYYAIKGATEGTNFSVTGLEKESAGNYYFTAGDVTDYSKFYVKADTATLDHDGTGQIVVEKAGATVTVQNATYRDTSGSKNLNIVVGDGGVLEVTHSGSNGYVTGDITINGGGTFRVAGQHDAFGWGGGTTKNIILQGENGKVATLDFQQTSSNSATFNAALKMMGNAAITGAKGFNTHDGSFYAEGLNNTIESFQIRHAATFEVKEGGELTVETMTRGADGNKTLTKSGKGTMTFTKKAQAEGLVINEGDIIISGGTENFFNALTIGTAGTLKVTGGTTTVSGNANVISNTITVTGGTLNLTGSYAIDDLAMDAGGKIIYYDDKNVEANSGFLNAAGSKTVYTKEGGELNRSGAAFTVGGQAVAVGDDGKYTVAGTTEYTTLWVNGTDSLNYDTYYAASNGALTTARVANGATLAIGTQAVGTLAFQTNGSTINLTGTGNVNAISGTGTLNLDGANATLAGTMSVNSGEIFNTTGAGSMTLETLKINGGTVNVASDLKVTGGGNGEGGTNNKLGVNFSAANGTLNINARTTTVTGAVYSNQGGTTINIGTKGTDATLVAHRMELSDGGNSVLNIGSKGKLVITSTNDANGGTGSYKTTGLLLSEWLGGTTATVDGKLYAQSVGLYTGDAGMTLNVNNGGVVAVKGIATNYAAADHTSSSTINMAEGGKLVLGESGMPDCDIAPWTINLNGGEVGMTADTTIARAINVTGPVTFNTAKYTWSGAGKDLTLNEGEAGGTMTVAGVVTGSGNITKKGAGTLVVDTLNVTAGGLDVTAGGATIGYITKTGDGEYTMSGTGTTKLVDGISLQAGKIAMSGNYDISDIYVEPEEDPTYTGGTHAGNGFAVENGTVTVVDMSEDTELDLTGAKFTWNNTDVTVNAETGKAAVTGTNYGIFHIFTESETVSQAKSEEPAHALSSIYVDEAGTLTVDQNISASLLHALSLGTVSINEDVVMTAASDDRYVTLAGTGTYALANGTSALGHVTLGEDWAGIVRISNVSQNNIDLAPLVKGTLSTVELNGFSGWTGNNLWKGLNPQNIKLTNTSDGGVAWYSNAFSSGSTDTAEYSGKWSGEGTFATDINGDRYLNHTYTGDISEWTGVFEKRGAGTSILKFSGNADEVNVEIKKTAGTLNVIADAEGIVFSKGVDANAFTANVATTLKGETTIGSFSGAGALTIDAGENTVTVNGISGLANTITLTSGSLSLNGIVDISNDMPVTGGGVSYIGGQDKDNGFRTVEGLLQVVSIGEGAHLIEGEGISYRLGGEEIATALDNGAITVEPTTTYGTFYVKKAGTTESIANAIRVATEASSTLTAVVMSADTTLAADAEATYSLALDADASAKVDVTAATTISSLTGPVAGKTLTVTGSNAITIQSASDFEGNVSITGATVKLGSQTALGKYNTDTAKVITIGAGGTVDTNGQIDANYNYVLAGGTLTNTGDGKNVNNSQTTGLTLTANSYIGSEGQNEMWVARRGHAANTIELGGYTLTKNGAGLFGFKNSAITEGTLQVNAGTVKLEGSSIAANVVLNGGALTGTLTPSADINVTAQQSVTIGSDLAFSIAEGKTLTLKTAEEQAITFSTAFAHANGKLAAAGTVNFTQGLTPNSGTVEVSGTVNVSGKSLDLSNGGNSKGKLNVTGTGVLNVNNGMWMNTNAIDIAEGGTMNIAGLHIVGEEGGATIATTEGNQNYGTNNDKYVITNAAVTGTTNINLGNQLVNSTLTTGAYTMTLNNAASTYDAVYVSTGGTLVVNADINLAGVLHSSGAITVNEEKSLTLTEGSSLFQTVTNGGAVSLTGITLGGGFSEQQGGEAHFNAAGEVTLDANYYIGTTESYVQVVANGDSATSTGTGILWQGTGYGLETDGRIITGHGSVNYGTYYITDGRVNMSEITALHSTTDFIVSDNGTLVVDQETQGQIHIDVQGTGTITGDKATPEDVQIETLSTAEFTKNVEGVGYEFKVGDAAQGERDTVTITNFGEESAKYTAENPDMMVTTQTLEMTDTANDAVVTNKVWVNEIVNVTGRKLTLENEDMQLIESMTIGAGSTVAVYETDEQAAVEGTVTITESLTAGGGKLLANLTLEGGSTLDLGGAGENALTLGSTLTVDTESGLILLDDATITALEGLALGHNLDLFKALEGTGLEYGGSPDGYDGTWFDAMFVRTENVHGDYRVYATEDSFGLTKVNNVPEPTTGTLSLLALAALAARRRRK